MKKQKVVLGTDDKHVYFKMQNRKQAVRFAKWFVYICACASSPLYNLLAQSKYSTPNMCMGHLGGVLSYWGNSCDSQRVRV